ncbi:MAG TPA: hypothetical protein VH877_11115, partial [Polyangia bacterium]|nr:hypothetical protein [Polyangia bacterium]
SLSDRRLGLNALIQSVQRFSTPACGIYQFRGRGEREKGRGGGEEGRRGEREREEGTRGED